MECLKKDMFDGDGNGEEKGDGNGTDGKEGKGKKTSRWTKLREMLSNRKLESRDGDGDGGE